MENENNVKSLELSEEQYQRLAKDIVAQLGEKQEKNRELRETYQREQEQVKDALMIHTDKAELERASIRFARMVKCLRRADGNPEKALLYAAGEPTNSQKGMYPFDKELHNQIKAMTTGVGADGGFLVSEQMVQSIIPYLYAGTVLDKLGARKIPMPSGNLTMPKLTTSSTMTSVAENAKLTKTQPAFKQIKMSAKKIGGIVPITKDLIASNSIEADMAVRDDLVQAMRLKLDYNGLYGSGVANGALGIKNYAAGNWGALGYSTAITGTGTTFADLVKMLGGLATNNVPMLRPGWAMNALQWSLILSLTTTAGAPLFKDEMAQGKILGIPFAMTNQIPSAGATHYESDIFLADWSELLWGIQTDLEITTSEEGSYTDGGTTYNAFEYDLLLMKIISRADFAPMHSTSFACSSAYYA